MRNLMLVLVLAAALPVAAETDRETLYQVSTLDALIGGCLDGVARVGDLLRQGNFGLGTFHAVDGEMVVLDGRVYRVTADGKVHRVPNGVLSPFASVTFFDEDDIVDVKSEVDMAGLGALLDRSLPSLNYFYAIRVDGVFSYMKTRSVPKQKKPYPKLTTVAATQPTFEMTNVSGTLVGFRCPSYVGGANFPAYHLHFLSDDRTRGGHVLQFKVAGALARVDLTPRWQVVLPEGGEFAAFNPQANVAGDVEKVEKGH